MTIDVREIIREYLKDHGFNGLFNETDGCACEVDNLFACSCGYGPTGDCQPGHWIPCPVCGDKHMGVKE